MSTPVALLGLPSVQDVVEKIASTVWGAFADALIPDEFKKATGKFFTWLVAVPNPARASAMPNIDKLHGAIMALAVAVFALVVLTAAVRYFFTGLTSNSNPVEALGRGVAAAVGLLAYTWAFGNAIAIVNVLTAQIFAWPIVQTGITSLGHATFAGVVVPGHANPLTAIFTLIAFLLVVALIAMKVVLLIVLTVLYVGGPLAIAVWPLPELAGYTRSWLDVLKNVLAVPLMWTLVFATSGVLVKDIPTLIGVGSSGIARTAILSIVTPLVAVIVFYLAFRLAAGSISGIKSATTQFVTHGSERTKLSSVAVGMALGQGRMAVMRSVRSGTGASAVAGGAGGTKRNGLAAAAATGGAAAAAGAVGSAAGASQAKRTAKTSDQAASRGRSGAGEKAPESPASKTRTPAERPAAVAATQSPREVANGPQKAAQRPVSTQTGTQKPISAPNTAQKRTGSVPPPAQAKPVVAPAAPSRGPRSAQRPAPQPAAATQPQSPKQSQRAKVERAGGNTPSNTPKAKPARAKTRASRLRPRPDGAN